MIHEGINDSGLLRQLVETKTILSASPRLLFDKPEVYHGIVSFVNTRIVYVSVIWSKFLLINELIEQWIEPWTSVDW